MCDYDSSHVTVKNTNHLHIEEDDLYWHYIVSNVPQAIELVEKAISDWYDLDEHESLEDMCIGDVIDMYFDEANIEYEYIDSFCLASEIDEYLYQYDTYDYQDRVDDRMDHITSVANDIQQGNVSYILNELNRILEDLEENVSSSLKALISKIKKACL